MPRAGFPFILLNTLCGAYCAYGFSALRYTAHSIILYGVIVGLQSLIAIQVMIFCVYVTSNQARATLEAREGAICLFLEQAYTSGEPSIQ